MAIIEKLETQIKELRGLLQEALNGPGWQDEYWRSAAEGALGEENELTDQVEQLRQCQQADGWTINQQSKEIERLRERITNALDALNDADISGATLILYEGVREALNE